MVIASPLLHHPHDTKPGSNNTKIFKFSNTNGWGDSTSDFLRHNHQGGLVRLIARLNVRTTQMFLH